MYCPEEKISRSLNSLLKGIIVPVLVTCLFICNTAELSAQSADEVKLEEALNLIKNGVSAYKQSDFNQAISKISEGLEILEKSIDEMKAKKDLIDAHLHLGLAYIGLNKSVEAKAQFKHVVELDPTFSLDQSSYSKKVLAEFNAAKAEYLSELVAKEEKKNTRADLGKPALSDTPPEEKKEKAFYKKWWFWTIAAVSVVAVAAVAGQSEEDPADDTNDPVVLFSDDFNDGNYDGWTPYGNVASWTVVGGKLSHVPYNGEDLDSVETGNITWRIGSLRCFVNTWNHTADTFVADIFFGIINGSNYSELQIEDGWISLTRFVNDEEITGAGVEFNFQYGRKYEFEIVIDRTSINVAIDGNVVLSVPKVQPLLGRIGLAAYSYTGVQFEDVLVTQYAFDDETMRNQEKITLSPKKEIRKSRRERQFSQPIGQIQAGKNQW